MIILSLTKAGRLMSRAARRNVMARLYAIAIRRILRGLALPSSYYRDYLRNSALVFGHPRDDARLGRAG
jgi:hypothetical protein